MLWRAKVRDWLGSHKDGLQVIAVREVGSEQGFMPLDQAPAEVVSKLGAVQHGDVWVLPKFLSLVEMRKALDPSSVRVNSPGVLVNFEVAEALELD